MTKTPKCKNGGRHAWGLWDGRRMGDMFSGFYKATRECRKCGLTLERLRGAGMNSTKVVQ